MDTKCTCNNKITHILHCMLLVHSGHFFSGCIMQCSRFQDLPGGIWRWSEKCHDRLDDSECHDDTAQIGVYACPLWIIHYILALTVFMKLMLSTNFDSTNERVFKGCQSTRLMGIIFVWRRAWQPLPWNMVPSAGHTQEMTESLTDTWQEGCHRCPCWVTNVSLMLSLTDGYMCQLEAQISQHLQT